MATQIVPASRKDWLEELGMEDASPDKVEILDSVLFLVAAHLRPQWGEKAKYVTVSQMKRFYGKILWNYLGDIPPSLNKEKIPQEIGHLYFAYLLRRVLEAKPVISREVRRSV